MNVVRMCCILEDTVLPIPSLFLKHSHKKEQRIICFIFLLEFFYNTYVDECIGLCYNPLKLLKRTVRAVKRSSLLIEVTK